MFFAFLSICYYAESPPFTDTLVPIYRWPKPRHHPYQMLSRGSPNEILEHVSDQHFFKAIMHRVDNHKTVSELEYDFYIDMVKIYG